MVADTLTRYHYAASPAPLEEAEKWQRELRPEDVGTLEDAAILGVAGEPGISSRRQAAPVRLRRRAAMDDSYPSYAGLCQALLVLFPRGTDLSVFSQGACPSEAWVEDSSAAKVPPFDPGLAIAHCFKQFQKDFHLPRSRRRVILAPLYQAQKPTCPATRPQVALQPSPSLPGTRREERPWQLQARRAWLRQRAQLRAELEALGDIRRWLENKPSITPSEAKVLHAVCREQEARGLEPVTATRVTKKCAPQVALRVVPQLRLPQPTALQALFSYLRGHKIQVLELFSQARAGPGFEHPPISREEFLTVLKKAGVPLKPQEMEDVVIYLSSLGRHNTITMECLAGAYKQWTQAHPSSSVGKHGSLTHPVTGRLVGTGALLHTDPHSLALHRLLLLAQCTPRATFLIGMDLLTVPTVATEPETRPLTLEEMEDVGRRYRERRRQLKLRIPPIQYTESCRLVRSGNQRLDEHCLPSTIVGDSQDLIDVARREDFLTYLQCCQLCQAYGLPLTEDLLARALLYPGDKIIRHKDQVRPLRQPGGYYVDWNILSRRLPPQSRGLKSGAKKSNELRSLRSPRYSLSMGPQSQALLRRSPALACPPCEFATPSFTRKLRAKRPRCLQWTQPNSFWPGHLLDKLRLCLPEVALDRSLALFSCVQYKHSAYPAAYHTGQWWPVKNSSYVTHANYDSDKIYFIS
ncbi:EF-hand calcium-binding domain-containing protein 12 [Ctenodactylus gundi]